MICTKRNLSRDLIGNHLWTTIPGNVTVYLKVKNKDKFLRYINRTWKENADPTRFIKGKPIYLGLRDKSNNPSDEVKKAKAFIKKAKKR